jgi:hypothetical protein
MQILTINNQNFQKPSRNPANRIKVKILKKKFFWITHPKNFFPNLDQSEDFEEKNFLDSSSKKIGSAYAQSPRKCSNIKILAKIDGKEAKFFFENLRKAYKDLI